MIYKIYNYVIKSNIDLNRLEPVFSQTTYDISFNFFLKSNLNFKEYCEFEMIDNYYIINLYKIIYKINLLGNEIEVYCDDLEYFYSTCYNLPFSIISYINGNLLLHSSSIEINDRVIAFCGKKGQGKTTLVASISKLYNFYSDDTVILTIKDNLCICQKCNSPIRINKDSLNLFDKNNNLYSNSHKNIMLKAYIEPHDINLNVTSKNSLPLDKIVFLNRSTDENSNVSIRKIENIILKNSLLLTNIVGSKYFPFQIISNITNYKIYNLIINRVDFYILNYPNNFEKIDSIIEELKGLF